MPDKVFIGKFSKGFQNYYQSFYNDNDSWATLFNAYVYRGRVERKRGTSFLARLQIQVISVAMPTANWQRGPITLAGDEVNLSTALMLSNISIVPGSISFVVGSNTYTEPDIPDGTLVGAPSGSGMINYATTVVTITGGGSSSMTGEFSYYPGNPVEGLRDFVVSPTSINFPVQLSFDTTNAYQINQTSSPFQYYNVTYYKGTNTPFVWSGFDYQQFWTENYQGAIWSTNNKPGLHLVNGTYTSGSGTTAVTFNFKSGGVNYTKLIVGDKLWFNEWTGTNINGVTGTVSTASGASSGNYVVTFGVAPTVSGTGIAQLLTNSISGQDGIKWYDGDPTNSTGIPTGTGSGWVNFAPPLTQTSVVIENLPPGLYYLVGALIIQPFKDRLLFFSPYVQTSGGTVIQLFDAVIWSWNGTAYYTSPTPVNQTFDPTAYYIDQTGKGGYQSAGIYQPIATVGNNEDVLLVGFGGNGRKTRFVYTGDDIQPFILFNIKAELPSTSTFSAVVLDRGTIDMGTYGICMTDQQTSRRIDLDMPQEIFSVSESNNGVQRVNAIRDFYREWIYFSYTYAQSPWIYPSNTFLYNYRENTWAILYENWTAHGRFRGQELFTWATVPYATWAEWNVPWNDGLNNILVPDIIAGNPQGYVLILDEGTGEGVSGYITSISTSLGGLTIVGSINHCVNQGDYIQIQGVLGPTGYNTLVGRVILTTDETSGDLTPNAFIIDVPFISGTYLGLGQYIKMIQPLMVTKQFNFYWQQGKKTQLGVQKYLFTTTARGQVTENIYLSQDTTEIYNMGPIYPNPDTSNDALIYSQVVYTCPESTNLGLTPANTNLMQINDPQTGSSTQNQMWHRMNTSMIGDTIQIGFTLSDAQMRNTNVAYNEISLQGIDLTIYPSQDLA
jgi:hypothetical protein